MTRNPSKTKYCSLVFVVAFISSLALGGRPGKVEAEVDEMVSLKDSVAAFQEHFNRLEGRPRFVTLLSPT